MFVVKCIQEVSEKGVSFLPNNTYVCYKDIFNYVVRDSRLNELMFDSNEFKDFFEIV